MRRALRMPGPGGRRGAGAPRFAWPTTLQQSEVTARGLARGPGVVALRPLVRGDEAAWRALRLGEDDRLRRWEATLPPEAGEEPEAFKDFVRAQHARARRGEVMPFVIEVDGDFAGQLTVAPIHWGALRTGSVGYWIAGRWEGRGVMTLALAMVLDHLPGDGVGLHRVEVNVRPDNARSVAVCRRVGLVEEGVRRGLMHIDGRWSDHLTFAVIQEDVRGGPGFVRRLGSS